MVDAKGKPFVRQHLSDWAIWIVDSSRLGRWRLALSVSPYGEALSKMNRISGMVLARCSQMKRNHLALCLEKNNAAFVIRYLQRALEIALQVFNPLA